MRGSLLGNIDAKEIACSVTVQNRSYVGASGTLSSLCMSARVRYPRQLCQVLLSMHGDVSNFDRATHVDAGMATRVSLAGETYSRCMGRMLAQFPALRAPLEPTAVALTIHRRWALKQQTEGPSGPGPNGWCAVFPTGTLKLLPEQPLRIAITPHSERQHAK